jgi:hypothetical protein
MKELFALWLAMSITTLALISIGIISIKFTNIHLVRWRIPIILGFIVFAPIGLPLMFVVASYQSFNRR